MRRTVPRREELIVALESVGLYVPWPLRRLEGRGVGKVGSYRIHCVSSVTNSPGVTRCLDLERRSSSMSGISSSEEDSESEVGPRAFLEAEMGFWEVFDTAGLGGSIVNVMFVIEV